MTENAELTAIVLQTVSGAKETARIMQDLIAESQTGYVKLDVVAAQSVTSQLRITANLVQNLLEENATLLDRIQELVDRVHKK